MGMVITDNNEKPLGFSQTLNGMKAKLNYEIITKQNRMQYLRLLMTMFPEIFEEEEIKILKDFRAKEPKIILGAGVLYSISIVLGNKFLFKSKRIPFGKAVLIYFFPLLIAMNYILFVSQRRFMEKISIISDNNKEKFPNDVLYSYNLALYRGRFI